MTRFSIHKLISLGLLSSLTIPAHASFELLMALDNDATLGYHVDRYDPDTGAYLGNFAGGRYPSYSAVEANKARGEAYCLVGSGVAVFDYSTGGHKNFFSWGGPFLNGLMMGQNGFLYGFGGNSVLRMDMVTGAVTSLSGIPTTNIAFFTQTTAGVFLLGDRAGGALWASTNGTTWNFAGAATFSNSISTSDAIATKYTNGTNIVLYSGTNDTRFLIVNPATGAITSGGTYGDGSLSQGRGYAAGHVGSFHLGDSTSLTTDVIRYTSPTGFGMQILAPSTLTQGTWLTSVVAPEPSSMLIIFGAGILFHRRKR